MVEIIEDWDALMEHARYCHMIVYKINRLPEGVRLRVRVGSFGYDKVLSEKEAKEKEEYLKQIGAVKIVDSVADSIFFVG
jgi:gamma-glutamyl phosphate reductase